MNKTELEMLLLSLTPKELHLLGAAVTQQALATPSIDIDIEAFAQSVSGLSVEAAYLLLESAANRLLDRSFEYSDDDITVSSTLLTFWTRSAAKPQLKIKLSEPLYDALRAIDRAQLADMLDSFSKPPVCDIERAYSSKLYLLLTKKKNETDIAINYTDLREELGINPDSYSLMQNFKRRILTPAIKDINKLGIIEVCYEDIAEGRKIVGFRFHINQTNDL